MNRTAESNTKHRTDHGTFAQYCARLTDTVAKLSQRLQARYESLYPGHREMLRRVIAEAEAASWELSRFPHLLLPDLVEARLEALTSDPAFAA